MNVTLKNFVAGDWLDGAGLSRNINPSNTTDVIGEYARADTAQTVAAIAAAKAAFPAWSRSTPQARFDASTRSRSKFYRARTNSVVSWPARKARPCRRASARLRARGRFSRSSQARRCA